MALTTDLILTYCPARNAGWRHTRGPSGAGRWLRLVNKYGQGICMSSDGAFQAWKRTLNPDMPRCDWLGSFGVMVGV